MKMKTELNDHDETMRGILVDITKQNEEIEYLKAKNREALSLIIDGEEKLKNEQLVNSCKNNFIPP